MAKDPSPSNFFPNTEQTQANRKPELSEWQVMQSTDSTLDTTLNAFAKYLEKTDPQGKNAELDTIYYSLFSAWVDNRETLVRLKKEEREAAMLRAGKQPEQEYRYFGEHQRQSEPLRLERLDEVAAEFNDARRMLQNTLFKLATYEVHPATNQREAWHQTEYASTHIHAAMKSIRTSQEHLANERKRVVANKMPADVKSQFTAAKSADLRSLQAQTGKQQELPAEKLKRPVAKSHLEQVAAIANQRSEQEKQQAQNNDQGQNMKR